MRKPPINYLLQKKAFALSKMQQIMVYQTSLYDLKIWYIFICCFTIISKDIIVLVFTMNYLVLQKKN